MSCSHTPLRLITVILLIALQLFLTGGRAARADWLFSYPPNQVSINSDKRNNVFYAGTPVSFTLSIANYGTYALQGTVRYEVRDYWGTIVAQGTTVAPTPTAFTTLSLPVTQPGWYKLSLHQAASQAPWGDSVGGTMFVIFRNDANFPAMPGNNLPDNLGVFDGDEVARGVIGMGPQRHPVTDASQPDQAIAQLDPSIALDKQYYTPFDSQRSRPLLIAFPNGVADSDAGKQGKNLDGLRQIVTRYHGDVKYWEPRNEPNYAYSGADYVNKELKPFYQTVKSVDPSCKVLGPGVVTIGPYGLGWIEDFLKAGGANYIDAFSFHAYNNVNGDLTLARQSLDALDALLTKYGVPNMEKWQTEQGYFAAVYGSYQPRLQGRWTMLQMMVYEQYGIPKEHNHLWYDKSHGFWDFPAFWENEDGPYSFGSFDPAAPLMRVWSEELYGTNFAKAYDFGALGNKLYVGSLFGGPGKQVAAFMSAGRTDGKVTLNVSGGTSIHVVSAFGVARDLPVTAGVVTLPVPEVPVYVEMAPGQTVQVVPVDYGSDLALTPGTIASASGTGVSPLDPSDQNAIFKVINGVLENWYWNQGPGDHPWMDNTVGSPAWVQVTLPRPMPISHVVVYAGVPWQSDSSLLDYEMQYDRNGQWVTIDHVQEPTNVVTNFTPTTFTTVDSFYSDRCIFEHDFAPVTTSKIRLLVHDTTWGGGATQAVVQAGGQTGPHQITLREIEVYGDGTGQASGPKVTGKVRYVPRTTCASRMLGGRFQGSIDGVNYADLYTVTSTPTEGQWTEATFAVDPTVYRYLRYLSPNGGWGNVAEVEFFAVSGANATKLTGTPFGTPGSYNNAGSTFNKVFDGDLTTCFDAPGPDGDFAGIDQGTAGPTLPTVTAVSVTPLTATVAGGQTQQFTAAISGTGSPAQTVIWSASAGSISSTGLFAAPAATSSVQTVTVTATSTVDGSKNASATLTIPIQGPTVTSVAVSPSTATVAGGQTQQFSATVSGTGSPAQTVTWSASAGSVTTGGLFTAPAATSSVQTVTVTATSSIDSTKSASATVIVPAQKPTVTNVTVSPSAVSVAGGQTQQFSAAVIGSGNPVQTVTWSASAGSVTTGGLFTAPAALPSAQTATVTATSTIDSTKSGTATVTVPPLASSSGASALFVGSDTSTQGSWKGVYGTDGYSLSQDTSANNPSLPAYAQVALSGSANYNWVTSTTDPRALLKASQGSTDRLASCWYSTQGPDNSFDLDVTLTDGQSHRVSLYCLDWDRRGRIDAITVRDGGTRAVLDTQTAAGFGGGTYLTWTVKGHVVFHVSCGNSTDNFNAVLSAVFFGGGSAGSAGSGPTVPAAPANLKAVGGDGQVALSWDGVPGASSYSLYRATTSGAETLLRSGLQTTGYTDTGLTIGQAYYYKVTALSGGTESVKSGEVSAVLAALSELSVSPTSVSGGSTSTGSVTLSAAAPAGGLNVSLSSDQAAAVVPPSVTVAAGQVSATFTITTGTVPAPTTAHLSAAYGAATRTATLTVTPTGTQAGPTNLVAAAVSTSQINLSWSAFSGATGYTVERSSDGTTGWARIASAGGTSFSDYSGSGGVTYYYRIRATTSSGISGLSSVASAAVFCSAPQNLVAATNSATQIGLTWAPVPGATGYSVRRSTTGGGPYTKVGTTGTPAYNDSGLSAGTACYYVVSAVNSSGEGNPSGQAGAFTLCVAPSGLTATAVSATQVNLTWTGSPAATSYSVDRSSDGVSGWSQIANGNGTSYSDYSIASGATYYYRVRANDAGGTSLPSNVASSGVPGPRGA